MHRSWSIPSYLYRQERIGAQLRRLLGEFMRLNGNDRGSLARELGLSTQPVTRWLNGEVTTGLLTKIFAKFVAVTGIDLDRMIVIEAKLEILEKLKRVEALRATNPSYAFLLDHDPALADKISFDRLLSRDEIVAEVRKAADETGGPLTAEQIFTDNRYVSSWWDERPQRPSGEVLERVIIRLCVGFVRDDPKIRARDDTRFRWMCLQLLGRDAQDVLGVATLPQALNRFFSGKERYPTSVLATQLEIPDHALAPLRKWQGRQDRGSIMPPTMVAIIRALLRQAGHDDKVPALMAAFKIASEKNSRGWPGKPVFWMGETIARKESRPEPHPLPPPSATTPSYPHPSVLERARFAGLMAELGVLLEAFPQLKGDLPSTKPNGAEAFIALSTAKGQPNNGELQQIAILMRSLPKMLERVMWLPEEQRAAFLHQIDNPMIRIQQLLDAIRSTEPSGYLAQVVRPQEEASGLTE